MVKYVAGTAVIIPFYRDQISAYEAIALYQCFKVLHAHPIVAIKPNCLTLPQDVKKYPFAGVISFDDDYFKNIEGYNALKLSPGFYKAFLKYEFMLIHQLDAFVFKDELNKWCESGNDYIGAPWLREINHTDIFKAIKSNVLSYIHTRFNTYRSGDPSKYQYENKVGNGGFSLRRVQKFYEISLNRKAEIDLYLKTGGHHFNEDRFWSIEVNRKKKFLRIPGYKTGLKFAFEFAPQRALKINKSELPFGCHAWDRYADFWKPIFQKEGYTI